jgi:Arc/MetJ family transcription regulator
VKLLRLAASADAVVALAVYNFHNLYTSREIGMRTNIVIDDELMAAALDATGARTKREVVELGLGTLVRLREQANIRDYRGKLDWQEDLERMRVDR